MSLDCPGGVTSNVICLDSTDYEEFLVCSMTEGKPCELAIVSAQTVQTNAEWFGHIDILQPLKHTAAKGSPCD